MTIKTEKTTIMTMSIMLTTRKLIMAKRVLMKKLETMTIKKF
jgi:hypothetical protein